MRTVSVQQYLGQTFVFKSWKKFLGFLILLVLILLSKQTTEFSVSSFIKGVPRLFEMFSYMFPPDWAAIPKLIHPAITTIAIAFLGTLFGSIISLVFGLAAANNIAHKWLRNTSRFIIATERAIPEIIIILILVSGLGLGALPGIITLSIACIGMLGKLFADAVEEIDEKILEAIRSTGATHWQVIRFGVLPQIFPSFIANTIFRFEINIRMSVIIGAVGAGGIGFELFNAYSLIDYPRMMSCLIIILVLVVLSERMSDYFRKKYLDTNKKMNTSESKFYKPSIKIKRRAVFLAGLLGLVSVMFWAMKVNPFLIFSDMGYMFDLLFTDMLPPNISILWTESKILSSIYETVCMAFLGTIIGGSLALTLAFFASFNTTPSRYIRFLVRSIFSIERVTPSLIIILFCIYAFGIGAFAGTVALAISSIGTFGKLFSDAIEQVDPKPVEALYSTGANKLQTIRYCILPQSLPSIIANFFYAFDVNLRVAIPLGIFGGGGIGYELHMAKQVLRYKDVIALTLFTIVLIVLLEKVSDYLRNRLINGEKL
jgi:phosphonate transport system permease protein